MVKVGVIGVNRIGLTHADAYRNDPGSELVCVCDMLEQRAIGTAERLGVRSYTAIGEMLTNEQLDAVSVATGGIENGSAHYEPVMECLEAGVHVLVEKPISNNIDHGRKMVRTAREKGLYFGVNLNHRFVPLAAQAKGWMDAGKLGEPLFVNMALWIDNPNDSSPYFHLRALHPHSFDVMRYFCGPIRKVQAFATRPSERESWSNFSVNVLFDNNAVGHLTGSYDASWNHPIERCEVMGTEGRFVLENVYEALTLYPRRSPEKTVISHSLMGGTAGLDCTFHNRIHRWIEQIDAKAPREEIDASGEQGLAAQEAIEAAIRSFEGGTVEELTEAQSLGTGA